MSWDTGSGLYPFERFTDDAKKVLTLAQAEAERSRHSYIGTEHLLLALVTSDTEAARLLRDLGVEETRVRSTIANVLGRNERIVIQQIIPTSRVKKVIELAFAAARDEGSESVGPMHLLVALVEEGEGIAAHVLKDLGVTPEALATGRLGEPRRPWPQPGARVLIHDPEPPYRLWEGSVSRHDGDVVRVIVPDHPTRPEAEVPPAELHPVPMRPLACERCRYPAGA
jgi:hypothetical protein